MHLRALFPLLLPLLCMAHTVRYRSPPPSCPDGICVCSASKVPIGRFQQQQQEAICTEIPKQRLTKTITSLRVNGQITKITKKMIANLGGELLSLDMSDCEIQSIEPGSFDAAPKLIKLKLSNNLIEEIEPGMFKKNNVLRKLYLDGNRLKQIDESAFAKLEQLRELHVEKNYLTQFPSKIPIGLTVLNVSQNNLGPNFACDIRETNIKDLDLCGNHLEQIENSTLYALNKLQNLCIGDKAVHFPTNTATYLPHLAKLSLVASMSSHAVLDSPTQTALGDMEALTSLSIVNYKIESLSFLHSLTKLRYLTLQDVTTTHVVDFQSLMLSKISLIVLNLEESYNLAHTLLDNMQVLGTLTSLQKISFRKTNITHVAAFDVPHTNHTQLDISNNPLTCDCGFAWLKNEQNKSMKPIILNSDETICATPSEYAGKKLMDVIDNLDCPSDTTHSTNGSHPLNRRYSNRRPTTHPSRPTTTPIPNEGNDHHWPISQGGSGLHVTPVKFPSHPASGEEPEILTNTNQEKEHEYSSHPNWNSGRPVKFPTHPPQGGEQEFPTNPIQGEESEFPTDPNQGKESEFPVNPNQGESELTTVHNQGTEPNIPLNTDLPETETTIKPMSTSNEFEEHQTEKEQSMAPTSESSHGMPEHMPIHNDDDDENDTSSIVYIILGTLLGLLILVGLILAIFYWKFKADSNKIKPASTTPGTTDGTPVEPSYQQLQHNEGSSLLKNVKK